jgi:hypothetical protein
MPHAKGFRTSFLQALSGLAVIGALVGAGWTLRAAARQNQPPVSAARKARSNSTAPASLRTAQDAPAGNPSLTPKATPPAAKSGSKPHRPEIEMDDFNHDQKTGLMTGRDFTYKDKDDNLVVTGVYAQYNNDTEVLDAKGSLVMDDPKHHVTGDKAHVERKIQLAVTTGNVVIVLKPKEEPTGGAVSATPTGTGQNSKESFSKDRNRGGTITCDQVEDYYKKEFAILKGHLVFKQVITKQNGDKVERTMTADHAEYDGKANKMHLFSPVKGRDTDDQSFEFEKDVFVGTKEGEETVSSKGRGIFKVLVEEEKEEAGKRPSEKRSDQPPKPPK